MIKAFKVVRVFDDGRMSAVITGRTGVRWRGLNDEHAAALDVGMFFVIDNLIVERIL